MKTQKIYAEILEDEALKQFNNAMALECNVQGALMPDAHSGYTLPIGAVIKSKKMIFPSYVGYDIGCGMCAVKLDIEKKDINLKSLKESILKTIPLGFKRHDEAQKYNLLDSTNYAKNIFNTIGRYQLGTLGGGNHFIELGVGKDEKIWIIIHSGSRGFGKIIAEHYMMLAAIENIDTKVLENKFEANNDEFKKHNPEKFEITKRKFLIKELENLSKKKLEGHFGFDINSESGKNYFKDMTCALDFALSNRKQMINKIVDLLGFPKELIFINRNHNHAELKDEYIIHRKGATHAEKGMMGVIPANMKDGSFIVIGKGCEESLHSSSHGAGRVLSRKQAKIQLNLQEFYDSMQGIESNYTENTLDESPKAYKNIVEVMNLQKDLVDIIEHVKPILNIKG